MRLEYVTCRTPESPPIVIRRLAMDGIHREVSEAFAAAPHRGAEAGGILLGRCEENVIVVEDFEPVPSEHRFGPSYRLSDTDRELLQETLEWFRGGAQPGLSVLGFYRSHTLPVFELSPEDEELMHAYFGAAEDLALLVRPSLMESSETDFFVCRCGRPAPLLESRPAVDPSPASHPLLMTWPLPRPRLEPEPERRAGKRWPWYTAALLVGLVIGALGYLWWRPETGLERIALAVPAPPAAQPVAQGAPVELEPDTAGIHQLLARWTGALRSGDIAAAAQCYAPVVSTYFKRHDVTRAAVRQSMARYGRLDVYRISGLALTPVSDNRAVATFRKHWQFSGHRRAVGEEDERMTLVRSTGVWEISSEQAETP
jgi:hypothetical protein